MSEIFKALQRRGTGGEEVQADEPISTFDVLRKAEHLAQERWERAAEPDTSVAEAIGFETLLRGGSLAVEPAQVSPDVVSTTATASPFEQTAAPKQIATIPVSIAEDSHLVSVADPDSPAAEAFRLLGVRLRDLRDTHAVKRLLITSTVPREGKSTVSANLACTLARSAGRSRTLLLEGDLRRPTQAHIFGLDKRVPGLCDFLQGSQDLTKCIYQLDSLGFCIMPSGDSSSKNPLGLLQPQRIALLMKQLGELFDLVIIDSPPVLPLADTSIWIKLVDAILLVTRHGVTERRSLQRGLEIIAPEKLFGMVMNSSTSLPHTAYYY